MKKKCVMVYGTGRISATVFDMFPELLEFVSCFIESVHEKDTYYGKEVCTPYKELFEKGERIIVSAREKAFELYGRLVLGYGIDISRITYIGEWLGEMLESHPEIKIMPTRARIESCTLCQLDCVECYMRKNEYGAVGKGMLKAKDFEAFLDLNTKVKSVELSNNGEAFLNPDICDIIRMAYKRDVNISFYNGSNFNTMTDEILESLVKYNVQGVTVSIDGVGNEVYKKYRRNGNFDVVIENIKKLNQYKKLYESDYPRVVWQFVLMEENEDSICMAKKLASELGIDIFFKLSWAGEYLPKQPETVIEETGLSIFNRKQYREYVGIPYNSSSCGQLLFEPVINWNGQLLGCCGNYMLPFSKNAFISSLESIINEYEYRSFIIDYLLGRNEKTISLFCSKCSGGEMRGMKWGRQIWI